MKFRNVDGRIMMLKNIEIFGQASDRTMYSFLGLKIRDQRI